MKNFNLWLFLTFFYSILKFKVECEVEGKFTFTQFCQIAAKFMIEDDEEQMKEELKEAFRIYDRDGQGFITTDVSTVKKNE